MEVQVLQKLTNFPWSWYHQSYTECIVASQNRRAQDLIKVIMAAWESQCNAVPQSHTWPDQCLSALQHDDYSDDADIPTIDLAGYQTGHDKRRVLAQVRHACLEWGFFQLVNHSVSCDLIQRVRHQALEFFSLPWDVKQKVEKPPGQFTGFGHATVKAGEVQPWAEGFYLNDVFKVDHASRFLWPHSYNDEFAVCYKEYDEVMKMLSMQLLGMVIESLDVTDTAHFEQYSKEASGLLRWNYYPACPEPHKTLGMQMHTDFTLLTILHLGDVGGLQVQCKSGHWLAVKPQPHAFAINIGDMIQVLTNGMYTSVPHRAVVNKLDARLSLAYLFLPAADVEVAAAPELLARMRVEPLYRPFKLDHYTKVKQMHFSNTLDHFTRE